MKSRNVTVGKVLFAKVGEQKPFVVRVLFKDNTGITVKNSWTGEILKIRRSSQLAETRSQLSH